MEIKKNLKELFFPLEDEKLLSTLRAGEFIHISGEIYTARDQAHLRLIELIKDRKPLPIEFKNNAIYYCGPTPPDERNIFRSAGPTTSSRMDKFFLILVKHNLKVTIGKGERSKEVINACKRFKAVYLITFGGLGAYLANRIKSQKLIAFEELGTEAIYKLTIEKFPVIVGIDTKGCSIFQ